jgi:hypothetical protein
MKGYKITQEQFESIQHFKRMFDSQSDLILEITKEEKPDILIGFELGKLYNYQRDCYIQMMELETQIKSSILP